MRYLISSILLLVNSWSYSQKPVEPLAHTFSIVARDSKTGELGVAVQSHWFSVGTSVAWGEAGVGVVATQSFINKSYGLRALELLKAGKSPEEALSQLIVEDEGRDYRQVAILDQLGRTATYTGNKCIEVANHSSGENFSVQANMMLNNQVVPAMEKAWKENDKLPLAERLVEVLKAGQKVGGDIRGKQAAALMIYAPESTREPWNDKRIDLRVDDAADPIQEINRLLNVFRAYEHMNKGDLYVEKNEMVKAMEEYGLAMKLFPDNLEMQYWTAITLANNKDIKQASFMLQQIYKSDPNWRELTKRLPKAGVLQVTEQELKELIR
jgi:uncharacterized Ntn-hydrolase superfamily protein